MGHEGVYAMTPIATLGHHTGGSQSMDGSHLGGSIGRGSSLSRISVGKCDIDSVYSIRHILRALKINVVLFI